MKWFVIIFFASWNTDGSQDIFVFKNPTYDSYLSCRWTLTNQDEVAKYIDGLMIHYNGVLPARIHKVNCIDQKAVDGLFKMKRRQENEVEL